MLKRLAVIFIGMFVAGWVLHPTVTGWVADAQLALSAVRWEAAVALFAITLTLGKIAQRRL